MSHRTIALDRLLELFAGMKPDDREALAQAAGLPLGTGRIARHRASYHHLINANTFLGLCAAAGVDALTGVAHERRLLRFEMCWHLLGAGLAVKRGDLSMQKVADIIGISKATLHRIETGNALSIESLLAVCTWMQVSPEDYAKCFTVPRETTPNTPTALKSQEVAA